MVAAAGEASATTSLGRAGGTRALGVRRRLSIGPGGPVYAMALLMVAGAAVYTQANLLFWAVGVLLGALLVSAGYVGAALRKVDLVRLPTSLATVGEPFVMRYELRNRSVTPWLAVLVRERWARSRSAEQREGPLGADERRLQDHPAGYVTYLGPKQELLVETTCWPLRRGRLPLAWVELSTSFPFGLLRRSAWVRVPHEAVVLPQLYRLRRAPAHRLLGAQATENRRLQPSLRGEELFELRPYRPGDPPRSIDWKQSAKTDGLVTRRYAAPDPPRAVVGLDLRSADRLHASPRAEERAISLAASLVCDAYLRGLRVGLTVAGAPDLTLAPRHYEAHRLRVLLALALLDLRQARRGGAMTLAPSVRVVVEEGLHDRRGRVPVMGPGDLETLAIESDAAALLEPTSGRGGADDPGREGPRP